MHDTKKVERSVPARAGLLLAAVAILSSTRTEAQEGLIGKIDLATSDGVAAVKGEWRYHPVTTGTGPKKNELEPKAFGKFDDSKWEVLKPETLKQGRGPGKYCWCWYRIQITIPEKVNDKPFTGGPVWFSTTVDDYGEVWVDGALNHKVGETGRGEVSGFNTMNRVRLQKTEKKKDDKTGKDVTVRRDPRPGEVFQIAVLGINGPLGNPPPNKIFLHKYTGLEFFQSGAPKDGANEPAVAPPPEGKEVAKLDLMKKEDVDKLKGEWRYHPVEFHTGKDRNEIEPKAHGTFDDSKWEVLGPDTLKSARGAGNFSMAWYRIKVTIPEKVGDVPTAGTAVWFRTTVDDYGEVWVNGNIDLSYGKAGRGAISGFNYPNQVLLTDNAKPGQTIQMAVLGINSPFGNPPGNRIFFRAPTEIRFFQKK
jgi:hypothetical protein